MNDRFKFRVWDKSNKRYVDTFSDAYNRIWRWYIDPDGNLIGVDEENVDRPQDLNNFTIEQCTGLKDKNGKLIYEGDIVKCDIDFVPDGRFGLIRKVVFKDGAFQLIAEDGCFYFIMGFHNIEIIGNIHEMEIEQ